MLGSGLSSIVYKGVDSSSSKPVAVKTIQLHESQLLVGCAMTEVKHLQLIDNENVVRLLDVKKSQ